MSSLPGKQSETRRPTLKVCLLDSSDGRRAEVKTALSAVTDPMLEVTEMVVLPTNGDGAFGTNGARPDAMMIVVDEDEDAPFSCLERLAGSSSRPALIALLQEQSPGLIRRATRAGADELLFLPLTPGDATRALIKVAEAKRRTERHAGGAICSVTSLVGGVGVTSVSVNLALALRHALDRRVALVDLDLQRGMLALALNVEPEHSILSLTGSDKAADSLQVEAALTKHSSGIYLLAAPKRIEDSEAVSDSAVAEVLDLMREMFDFVVVDTGNHVHEQGVVAWEKSDHLLYLLDQSIGGARCAWRFIDLFERLELGSAKPYFVVNRYERNYPVTPEQISKTLVRPIHAKLPRDDKTMRRVELSGRDLWQVAPGSPLARSFEELAHMLAQPPTEAPAPRPAGAVSRLVSSMIWRTRGANHEAC